MLLDRVSVGGMAEVFKAKSYGVEGFEKVIAIKRILPSMGEDRDFIKMFIDEAKIAGQLAHANICQIFELGRIDGAHFIAMEFIWGKDLLQIQNRLRKFKHPMAPAMAAYVMARVCEGLDYAHRKKDPMGRPLEIVHRDCSPQNILVSYEGEVKIIDFGIAKATSRSSSTMAGVLKGKFGYMSPEQVRGLTLDRRSDIFALGTMLFECLTGERLFHGETDFQTLERVRNVNIRKPREVNPEIPEILERIILKALSKDVGGRYQWCSELGADLQSYLMSLDVVFTAKALAGWIKESFSIEIDRERQQLDSYRRLGRDGLVSGGAAPAPTPAPMTLDDSHLASPTTDSEGPAFPGGRHEDGGLLLGGQEEITNSAVETGFDEFPNDATVAQSMDLDALRAMLDAPAAKPAVASPAPSQRHAGAPAPITGNHGFGEEAKTEIFSELSVVERANNMIASAKAARSGSQPVAIPVIAQQPVAAPPTGGSRPTIARPAPAPPPGSTPPPSRPTGRAPTIPPPPPARTSSSTAAPPRTPSPTSPAPFPPPSAAPTANASLASALAALSSGPSGVESDPSSENHESMSDESLDPNIFASAGHTHVGAVPLSFEPSYDPTMPVPRPQAAPAPKPVVVVKSHAMRNAVIAAAIAAVAGGSFFVVRLLSSRKAVHAITVTTDAAKAPVVPAIAAAKAPADAGVPVVIDSGAPVVLDAGAPPSIDATPPPIDATPPPAPDALKEAAKETSGSKLDSSTKSPSGSGKSSPSLSGSGRGTGSKETPVEEAAPVAGDGYLVVFSKPTAQVSVDGSDTGMTTPIVARRRITLSAGKHSVTLTVDGTPHVFAVIIAADQTTTLSKMDLAPQTSH